VGFRVDAERIDLALKSGFRILTLKDERTPYTIDVIFSSRKLVKRAGTILGLPTFYQSPEELIVAGRFL
jgi:hypothetical protein